MAIRESLYLDFKHECDNVDFNNEEKCDDSYQLMIEQLQIQFKNKKHNDKSLTQKDITYIKDVLNNLNLSLKEAYCEIVDFLCNRKCIKTYEQRHKYFHHRTNKDLGIYLIRAIEEIIKYSKSDHMSVAADLGMVNSEALDFYDAFNDENGWTEEI